MSPWENLIKRPQPRGHIVQVYDAEGTSLVRNVGDYLGAGAHCGDSMLVIATPQHWELFSRRLAELGTDTVSCLREGQIGFLDPAETLSEFMVAGQPDWYRFERTIRAAMRQLRIPDDGAALRAYGEMVAILWNARQFAAAVRLEQFWNKLLAQCSFSLYCSYAIDVFSSAFHPDALDALLSAHTHLVPVQPDGTLEKAFDRAMHEVLGPDAGALKQLIRANHQPSWAAMPDTESTILWIRKNLPDHAEEIVQRARVHFGQQQATAPGASSSRAPALENY